MPLFWFQNAARGEGARIQSFWAWWAGARPTVEAALDAKQLPQPLIDDISSKVLGIDPSLAWELGPGLTTAYQLTVTGEGDIERRAITERWYQAAPTDPGWQYHPARQAQPDSANHVLAFGPHRVDLADVRFEATVDENRERIDVRVWHPALPNLDDATQKQLTYLVLDILLGEDGVERWCGVIQAIVTAPGDSGVDARGLCNLVERLAASATGDRYTLARATAKDGNEFIVAVNTALKHIDHLDKASRLRAIVHLKKPSPNGMPASDESRALKSLEDGLEAAIADAVFAGRVTGGGKRTLNWYVADASQAKSAAQGVARQANWRVEVKVAPDPRWEGLKQSFMD
jgi:hypothetical protein